MGQYAESDIVLESNSFLRAVFFIPKNKERQVTVMRQAVTTVQYVFAGIGGFMGWFLGGLDGFLYALLMFVVIDYATGLMAAFVQKKVSSEVGFKGICKKVAIFCLVGIGHVLDTQVIQNGSVLRTAVILKDLGIGIIFEKENINTLDAKGEVLLTILSSLAQDESRSISENCTWGIRRRFETGKHKMSTKRFLGYDTDETGKLVINRTQEPIVVRLYQEFLDGKTTDYIKRIFEREGVKNWDGGTKWQSTTLMSMLENEKYKGDALLQKSYTVDFLTKKRTQNKGEIQMFYVEDDHDAIISKRIWECVQLEIKRRKKYLEEHGTNSYSHRPESNPFASKIICGDCNKVFARKGWRSSTGVDRKVWQCSERYKVKGVMGCANRHVEEETLIKAYLMAWNALVENREDFMGQWTEQLQRENLLEGYRAEKFIEYTDEAEPLTEMDTDFMLKTLDHIKVFEDGTLLVVFLDGTEIECKNEEE